MARTTTQEETQLAPLNSNLDFLRSLGGGAEESLGQYDVIMPRFKLIQNTSRTGVPGKWVSNLDSTVEFDSLDVVILCLSNFRTYFPEQMNAGDKPLCRSSDGKTKSDPGGIGSGNCAHCQYAAWTKDARGESVPPPCKGGYTILGLIKMPDGTRIPGMISIKGSGIKPARQFFTQMKTKPVSFSYTTLIGSTQETNAKGRYFVPTFAFGEDFSQLPSETLQPMMMEFAALATDYKDFVGSAAAIVQEESEPTGSTISTSFAQTSMGNNSVDLSPESLDDIPF